MLIGRMVTPLGTGVYCQSGVLTWVGHCRIGKCKCRVYAPSPYPTRVSFEPEELNTLDAPNQAEYYTLPEGYKELGWPLEGWGYINSEWSVTIKAVGMDLLESLPTSDEESLEFEQAVVKWRGMFHDWLSVIAKGSTDFESSESGIKWTPKETNKRLAYANYQAGKIYDPKPITRWEWNHAFEQTAKGEEAPLARKLLSLAIRNVARADNRNAVIHAATAAECALTDALRLRMSTKLSSEEVQNELNRNKMLGRRLNLAQQYGLSVPNNAKDSLLSPRNATVHTGSQITQDAAWAAVDVASTIINDLTPLPQHCKEPPTRLCEEDYENLTY